MQRTHVAFPVDAPAIIAVHVAELLPDVVERADEVVSPPGTLSEADREEAVGHVASRLDSFPHDSPIPGTDNIHKRALVWVKKAPPLFHCIYLAKACHQSESLFTRKARRNRESY